MAKIEVSRPHGLSPAEAKQKTEILVDQLQVKYRLTGSWLDEDRYQFKATGAKGEVRLAPQTISVRVELSILLSALKSKVEKKILDVLDKEFSA